MPFDKVLPITKNALDACKKIYSCKYCDGSYETLMFVSTLLPIVSSVYEKVLSNPYLEGPLSCGGVKIMLSPEMQRMVICSIIHQEAQETNRFAKEMKAFYESRHVSPASEGQPLCLKLVESIQDCSQKIHQTSKRGPFQCNGEQCAFFPV